MVSSLRFVFFSGRRSVFMIILPDMSLGELDKIMRTFYSHLILFLFDFLAVNND